MVSASRSPPKEPWWEKNNPPNMKGISSVQQFVDELVVDLLALLSLFLLL